MPRKLIYVLILALSLLMLPVPLLLSAPLCAQSSLSLTLRDYPCRVFDSRTDRALQDNEIAIVDLAPEFSILQGGIAGCGVPPEAAAAKLNIKGQSVVFDGGYFKVFNAQGAGHLGTYTSLQLAGPGRYVGVELDVPITVERQVGLHTLKSAHAIIDIVGYYTEIP